MKLIPLTQGKFAQVDDHWFDVLTSYKWQAHKDKNTWYAIRSHTIGKNRIIVHMHRIIAGTPKDKECDHKDHNGLNNLEENLRNCTHRQNRMNQKTWAKSGYKGVSYGSNNAIRARIRVNGTLIALGYFPTEALAAKAYDKAAKKFFKEFAYLNFPETNEKES